MMDLTQNGTRIQATIEHVFAKGLTTPNGLRCDQTLSDLRMSKVILTSVSYFS